MSTALKTKAAEMASQKNLPGGITVSAGKLAELRAKILQHSYIDVRGSDLHVEFARLDKNHDGKISWGELLPVVLNLAMRDAPEATRRSLVAHHAIECPTVRVSSRFGSIMGVNRGQVLCSLFRSCSLFHSLHLSLFSLFHSS